MRILFSIVGLVLLTLILAFALSNEQQVTVNLWPSENVVDMPLYAVGILPLLFGMAFGSVCTWIGHLPHRLHSHRLSKELNELNEKIGELRAEGGHGHEKKHFWSHS